MINGINTSKVLTNPKLQSYQNQNNSPLQQNNTVNKDSKDRLYISKDSYTLSSIAEQNDLQELNISGEKLDKLVSYMDKIDSIISKGIDKNLSQDAKKELQKIDDRLGKIGDLIVESKSPEKFYESEEKLYEKLESILGVNNRKVLSFEDQAKITAYEKEITKIFDEAIPMDVNDIYDIDSSNLTPEEDKKLNEYFDGIDKLIENGINKNLSDSDQKKLKEIENRLDDVYKKMDEEGETEELLKAEEEAWKEMDKLVGEDYSKILSKEDYKKLNELDDKINFIFDKASKASLSKKTKITENSQDLTKSTSDTKTHKIDGNYKDYNLVKTGDKVTLIDKNNSSNAKKNFQMPVTLKFSDKSITVS